MKAKQIDEGLLALGQDRLVRLSDVWHSPVFDGTSYAVIWQRAMYLSSLKKIEIERTDGHIFFKTRSEADG